MAPFPLCCVAGLASSESVATLAAATTGLVSGLGLEVLTQEAPDFKDANAPVANLVAEHKKIVKRSSKLARPLVIAGTVAAGAAAYGNRDKHAAGPLAVAAAVNGAVIALSLFLIKPLETEIEALPPPTNASPNKKPDQKQAAADSKARSLLQRWAKLHTVRVALSGFAFGSTLCGVLLLNKKH
ncbi:hypothetical protein COHA_007553 [Chlorella ohadii]|uniref:Uncharacterized protein n=1 Tax=Chlorella ohadii TaxID=2649997 RepID=A0AAD5H3F5_9CHLO|nr:hypothetical protein COHA_007553 [Chlorella ohadii]